MSSDRTTNGPMFAWLQSDLATNTKDWLIASWHHPPYSYGTHNSDEDFEMIEMRETFLPLLEASGADLVLCGHSHGYERSFLLDGHYGFSSSFNASMAKDHGNGRPAETGAYRKTGPGPTPHQGKIGRAHV